ncbi:MAG TPA: helix-turn-helix transcriptional regulator [Puia sp.]|jgi:transcriptional regulator with XRE-family HTH domain|nr:helix-turn-helix transcriptional regulator [Puia sp.]
MKTRSVILLPKTQRILDQFGENIKLARLRRKLSTDQVAERAGINRTTLWNIEKGIPTVAMGAYCQVLSVLGLAGDLLKVASDDELGRRLQDADLIVKKRAPKKK